MLLLERIESLIDLVDFVGLCTTQTKLWEWIGGSMWVFLKEFKIVMLFLEEISALKG